MSTFPDRVQQLVTMVGSVRVLSERSGVSRRSISKYVVGEGDPSRSRLVALQKGTGCSISWLVLGEGPMMDPMMDPNKAPPLALVAEVFIPGPEAPSPKDPDLPVNSLSAKNPINRAEQGLVFSESIVDQMEFLLSPPRVEIYRINQQVMATEFGRGDTVLYEPLGKYLDEARVLLNGPMLIEIDGVQTIAHVRQQPGLVYAVMHGDRVSFESTRGDHFKLLGRIIWHGHGL